VFRRKLKTRLFLRLYPDIVMLHSLFAVVLAVVHLSSSWDTLEIVIM